MADHPPARAVDPITDHHQAPPSGAVPARLERLAAVVGLLRSRAGRRALRWRPRSVAAWRLTTGVAAQGMVPATVIDVGANAGQFARASVEVFAGCSVLSFEPLAEAADRFAANLGDHPDVQLRRTALGRRSGSVVFHPHEYSLASSVLARAPGADEEAWTGEQAAIDVPLARLDDEVEVATLAHPVLLKLDVQGYEAEVLAGGPEVLATVDGVLVELAFVRAYADQPLAAELVTLLAEQGWRLQALLDLRRDRRGRIAEVDAYFVPDRVRVLGAGP